MVSWTVIIKWLNGDRLLWAVFLSDWPLRSYYGQFKIRRGDGNENVKKKKRFNKQNNNFARASSICVHFFAVFARLRREID